MTRRHLRPIAWLLAAALLYGQFAVAAYACPSPGSAMPATVSAMAGDCDGMQGSLDPAALKLCAEHCNYGHQSDLVPTVALPAMLLTALYVASEMPTASNPPQRAADLSALAEASPPLANLHCRFRI